MISRTTDHYSGGVTVIRIRAQAPPTISASIRALLTETPPRHSRCNVNSQPLFQRGGDGRVYKRRREAERAVSQSLGLEESCGCKQPYAFPTVSCLAYTILAYRFLSYPTVPQYHTLSLQLIYRFLRYRSHIINALKPHD